MNQRHRGPSNIARERFHTLLFFLIATFGSAAYPSLAEALSFTDDFNRPDSATVGNGWSDTAGNIGGNLAIGNNELTCPSTGQAGTFRPFAFTVPITTTARVKEQNGFGTLLRRYVTRFVVRNNGMLNQGYGVVVGRSDEDFANSDVILVEDNTQLASIPSTFQYGPEIHVSVTFNLDGSITGTVSEPAPSTNTFSFSFGPHAIQSTGDNFSIAVECSSGPVDQRIDDVSITDNKGFLAFPINVPCSGIPCTAFTAEIASVMDHSGTPLDSVNNPGHFYILDGKVTAYAGETGEAAFGTNCSPGPGYKNADGTDFLMELNYVGATCPPNKPHDPDANIHPKRFLNYDGHSGYDYRYKGAPIVAPEAGQLFKAAVDGVNHNSRCKFNGWREWHTFYIVHSNGYSTWYLHGELDRTIEKQIGNDYTKSVSVKKNQVVGSVGNFGKCSSVPYHLHFEVRKGLDQVVDPYSEGLWVTP